VAVVDNPIRPGHANDAVRQSRRLGMHPGRGQILLWPDASNQYLDQPQQTVSARTESRSSAPGTGSASQAPGSCAADSDRAPEFSSSK